MILFWWRLFIYVLSGVSSNPVAVVLCCRCHWKIRWQKCQSTKRQILLLGPVMDWYFPWVGRGAAFPACTDQWLCTKGLWPSLSSCLTSATWAQKSPAWVSAALVLWPWARAWWSSVLSPTSPASALSVFPRTWSVSLVGFSPLSGMDVGLLELQNASIVCFALS